MFNKNKKLKVYIEGMMCNHCTEKVKSTLLGINNVVKVSVDLKDNSATVFYNDEVDKDLISSKIKDLDYSVISFEEK